MILRISDLKPGMKILPEEFGRQEFKRAFVPFYAHDVIGDLVFLEIT